MSVHTFGPFRLDCSKRLLERDGMPMIVGGRQLDLLTFLVSRPGVVVSVRELMSAVWPSVTVEEANLRVCVSSLRKALGDGKDHARYIVNVTGRGYTFVAPVINDRNGDLSSEGLGRDSVNPLPAVPAFFVGREDAVEVLSKLLMSQRFVSVVGAGGVGKTSVALAVAHAVRPQFEDNRICFVDGGAISDPEGLSWALASVLRYHNQSVSETSSLVGEKRALVLLDSCEHLIESAASLVEGILHPRGNVHLLTTSREALRVMGEQVHLLQPLRCPITETPTAAQALASPAVQLFMEKAASSGHLATLGDEDAPIVSAICKRLDGIPLAIELVASRVGMYGIRGTVDLLDSRAELVLSGRRDASPRHQTLRALYDWSHRLLPAREQRVFARLSVFVGELTLAAAQAVAADPADDCQTMAQIITNLTDKSLVQVCSGQRGIKYRLLDTARTYAAYKLDESGETPEIVRRRLLYDSSMSEQTDPQDSTCRDTVLFNVAEGADNRPRATA
jgi:predicted ATPase/DNA-binding winged helix-turn-helix (wHTH) protein